MRPFFFTGGQFRRNFLYFFLFFVGMGFAQENDWPHSIQTEQGAKIILYQPQIESLNGNKLEVRAAVSVKTKEAKDPVFGAVWMSCVLQTDRDSRMASLESIKIIDVRFPSNPDSNKVRTFKNILMTEIPKWNLKMDLDRLAASMEEDAVNSGKSENLKNEPPKVIFEKTVAVLVLIDGEAKLMDIENTGVKRVTNTAFIILHEPASRKYFMNGNGIWYNCSSLEGVWQKSGKLPTSIQKIADDLLKAGAIAHPDSVDNKVIPKIILSQVPCELIQSVGEPQLNPIKGTNLLYVKNTDDNIFMDISSQQYFIVISGRWFKSSSLTAGPWTFVPSEKLPADFSKIPVGSEKDIVLANVAGTPQAKDAIHDAQVPQTATVDRKTASTTVTYDGEPKFEDVPGTKGLQYAVNTSNTVLKYKNAYYCVDNGVWFIGIDPKGPWTVSDKRPEEVENIPAESPVYNVKYVYIYESTPEVVYVGYTPGYMGCYVYGPTVVYGTGYYYSPWYGPYYYPHPVTYGYSMHYNPWTGWSVGMSMAIGGPAGWMMIGVHPYPPYWGPHYGGYWGPPHHYPPPYYHCNHHYGNTTVIVNTGNNRNNNYYRTNNNGGNMYKDREGVQRNNSINTNDVKRDNSPRNNSGVTPNDVKRNNTSGNQTNQGTKNDRYADREGNIRQDAGRGERTQNQAADRQKVETADRQREQRDAGAVNNRNSNQYQHQTQPSGAGGYGGQRPSGGGSGRGRR
ncbi:MAG: hypothetical protein PSX36_02660 [bacterium]|nr:hypothetical protein [bacterium]